MNPNFNSERRHAEETERIAKQLNNNNIVHSFVLHTEKQSVRDALDKLKFGRESRIEW